MSDKLNSTLHNVPAYTSSLGLTGIGVWTLQDWAVAIGIAFTILTFLLTWYYKHKQLQLAREQIDLTSSFQQHEDDEHHRPG